MLGGANVGLQHRERKRFLCVAEHHASMHTAVVEVHAAVENKKTTFSSLNLLKIILQSTFAHFSTCFAAGGHAHAIRWCQERATEQHSWKFIRWFLWSHKSASRALWTCWFFAFCFAAELWLELWCHRSLVGWCGEFQGFFVSGRRFDYFLPSTAFELNNLWKEIHSIFAAELI